MRRSQKAIGGLMILYKQQLSHVQKLSLEQMSQIIKSETRIEQIIANEALRGGRYLEK